MKQLLGSSQLSVPPLCLGTNVMGWTIDEKQSFHILDALFEKGFNFIDTADSYSRWAPGNVGGESETIIGRWLKQRGHRERMIVATKVASEMGEGQKGLSKKYIFKAVEASLRRLQTDYIDLYQAHWEDPETPQQETLEAFTQLIREGKVRVIGASNHRAETLMEAFEISKKNNLARYECIQPLYNLYDREDFETHLLALCQKEKIGVINYYSLASGFLSGKYRNKEDQKKSARGPSVVEKYLNDRGLKILVALDQVAHELQATPSQVALAWLIAQPVITAPIASATNVPQLEELVAATKLELKGSALELLNSASRY